MTARTKIWLFAIAVVLLIGIDIAGSSYLVHWREEFWTAIKAVDGSAFWHQIGIFSGVAILLTLGSGYLGYLQNLLTIELRSQRVRWYFSNPDKVNTAVENHNQRVEMDTWEYFNIGLSLLVGMGKSLVSLIVFIILLLNMAPSGLIIAIAAIYVISSTLLARVIAKPLVKLNYSIQGAAATFRKSLAICDFDVLNAIGKRWAKGMKFVSLFQALFGQVGVIIPYLILAPTYFTGALEFGTLMALASLIGNIIQEGGYIIGQQDVINRFQASRLRVKELITCD